MKQLEAALEQLNVAYNANMILKFQRYMEGVLEWNKMVNLTSICDPKQFINKHYVDSLFCMTRKEFKNASNVIDVGTGGGFPGVPLAIAEPNKQFLLIDSLNKRIKIVNTLCEEIGITNVTAIHGRAEELAKSKKYREQYDCCVSRAVANLSVLSEYCLPFVKEKGFFLSYKGPDCEHEIKDSQSALQFLGGEIKDQVTIDLSGCELEHQIIVIEKIKKTPSKYPRKAGMPSKEPLI